MALDPAGAGKSWHENKLFGLIRVYSRPFAVQVRAPAESEYSVQMDANETFCRNSSSVTIPHRARKISASHTSSGRP